MISVRLIAKTDVPPLELASHAAKTCYAAKTPVLPSKERSLLSPLARMILAVLMSLKVNALVKKFFPWALTTLLEVEKKLFLTGHHTTMEHTYFTFEIDGIDIGDVDFGLHLTTPHYNTDQRSGRYAKMFDKNANPVPGVIEAVKELYPDLSKKTLKLIAQYLERALEIYHSHEEEAERVCLKLHEQERPHLTDALRGNMKKLAQEQLRAFIPIIVPTGLDYTVDTITLSALYHGAWSPAMRRLTDLMVVEVLAVHPELEFCFGERRSTLGDFAPQFDRDTAGIIDDPWAKLISIDAPAGLKVPNREDKHPLDLTTVHPSFMCNEVGSFLAEIEVSLMTYGQDQRHRGIRRSEPIFTGNFILTPMLSQLGLRDEAMEVMEMFLSFKGKVPDSLLAVLAPYGASVHYYKRGSLNALCHEQGKRQCFCAQRDIGEPSRQLRKQLEANPEWHQFLPLVEPPCMHGPCAEPDRYCGRDMKAKDDYFPYRTV